MKHFEGQNKLAVSKELSGGASGPILIWLVGAVVCLGGVGAVMVAMISGDSEKVGVEETYRSQPRVADPVEPVEPVEPLEREPMPVQAAVPVTAGDCRDTDGGKVVSRFGMITGTDASGEMLLERDRCLDARTLEEFWCEGGTLMQDTFDCLGAALADQAFAGCNLGRCVTQMTEGAAAPASAEPAEPEDTAPEAISLDRIRTPVRTCKDSDGGGKIFRKGHTKGLDRGGKAFGFTDRCQDERHVTEYWCERGHRIEQTFDCLDPKFARYGFQACRSGSCVK